MIDLPPLEQLRETRRRLAEEHGQDAERYATMLEQVSAGLHGVYVRQPLLPQTPPSEVKAKAC